MEYACEHHTVSINCNDKRIHIISANYGRLGGELCSHFIFSPNYECVEPDSTNIVKDR